MGFQDVSAIECEKGCQKTEQEESGVLDNFKRQRVRMLSQLIVVIISHYM